ncbi:MAG: hypothetical protein IJU72_04160 [Bacteroidales bacterium]|nr:hypothetical protein [Bacteroidales bacterium]
MDKHKLIAACQQRLAEQLSNAKQMMDDAQQQSNDYGQNKDRYDPFRTKLMRQRDMHAKQYQSLLEQQNLLEQLSPTAKHTSVEFGSLVRTNRGLFFVATAIGRVEYEGQSVFTISMSAPIYGAMDGRVAGDSFEFNGIKHTIDSID